MSVFYYFSLTGSFPNQTINATKFYREVNSSLSASNFEYVNAFGDEVDVYFSASLNSASYDILTGTVAIHDGFAESNYGENFEDFLTLTGSRVMSGSLQMGGYSIASASNVNGVVVESHQNRHLYGGADSVDGDRVGIDFVPSFYVRNSSIPEAGDVHDLSAHLAGIDQYLSASAISQIFGTNAVFTEVTSPFSTTSNVFQTADTLNFVCSGSGFYRVGWMYVWSHDATNNDIQLRIRLDNSIDLMNPYQFEKPVNAGGSGVGGTDQRYENSGYKYIFITSGSHNVKLQVRSSNNGVDSTVHYSSIESWRVS